MAILLRPPVPRAPTRKGVSGFEVWEETRKRCRQQEDPAASSRGGLSGKAPHCEPPGEMDPSQLGWGQQEPRSRGCCWKLAPRLDPKGALAGKAQMTQTQPLSGRGGSAWAPRTAAVRGPALSAVLKPGVCGRRTGRGRFRRSICAPGAE